MEDDDHWQTRKSESPIPVPPIPDLAGNRGGNPRFPIRPKSGIGKSPVSRFGRESGIGVPIGRKSGNRGYPLREYIMHDPGLGVP